MLLRSISLLALVATVGSSAPGAAPTAAQGALLARALDAADAGDWPDAKTLASEAGNPIADDLVLWTRLRDGAGNWDEYGAFLARHPDWPSLAALRRAGERQMPSGQPPPAVFAFFDGRLPETGTGSLRLAEALRGAPPAEIEPRLAQFGVAIALVAKLVGVPQAAALARVAEAVMPPAPRQRSA